MVKACVERVIDVPIERAWEILSDFSHVYHVHPMVGRVDQVTPDKDRGLGAVRECHLYDGHRAVEKIVEWNEIKRAYTVELIDSDLPMKAAVVTLAAEDVGNGKSKLLAHMDMKAKYGILGKIMEHLFIKPQLGKGVGDLFAGVEEYDKTGVDIGKGYKGRTPAMMVPC